MLIHLHIGTPKSGTTYLQTLLDANRASLARQGVLWPGRTWWDQVYAVRDVLGLDPHGHGSAEVDGAWDRLVDEIQRWSGHSAILSMEWLVHATAPQVQRIVEALRPHEVRVVATARDIARTLPAHWQEQVQNWETCTWDEYVAAVTCDQPRTTPAGRHLFEQHDLAAILPNWLVSLPADHVTVVTVPAPGAPASLLWERFAAAIGVAPGSVDLEVASRNESIGAASAELLRRVNVATRERGVSWDAGDWVLKWTLAKGILSRRRGQEPRLALTPEVAAWARREADRVLSEVGRLGVSVIGSLAELRPSPGQGERVDPPSSEEITDAAVDGLAGLTEHIEELLEERRHLRERVRELEYHLVAARRPVALRMAGRVRREALAFRTGVLRPRPAPEGALVGAGIRGG